MKTEPELIIVKDVSYEDGTSYTVLDLIDPSCGGRGYTFSRLKEAIAYCKRQKVTYSRQKDLDILNH
jgi:hypothetical protein